MDTSLTLIYLHFQGISFDLVNKKRSACTKKSIGCKSKYRDMSERVAVQSVIRVHPRLLVFCVDPRRVPQDDLHGQTFFGLKGY